MPTLVGIIYPPPEVRSIVDKTATFVARNGPEFEGKIRANEVNNPKFNFLNPNDPYHAYYLHKVKEIAEGKVSTPMGVTQQAQVDKSAMQQQQATTAVAQMQKLQISNKAQDAQARIMEQIIVLKDPPPEFEFIIDAPPISPLEIDVIKLTAQFIARNGRPFLTSLMSKETRNPMFDFLKPQHSHFNYFTKLVDHYTKVLLPSRDLVDKMRREVDNPFSVLKNVQYRVEWERAQQREKQREDELAEKERVAYAQIDWHDFVVVETVDYQPNEVGGNFPPPTTPADVGARIIALERVGGDFGSSGGSGIENAHLLGETIILDEARVDVSVAPPLPSDETPKHNQVRVLIDKNMDQVAMDEESDEEKQKETTTVPAAAAVKKAPVTPLPPPQPGSGNIIIRKDYDPKTAAAAKQPSAAKKGQAEEFFKSPLTGELIPASMMSEHMRISMLDPRWIEQKQRERKEREEHEEVLDNSANIERNLKRLAEYRTDMFGSGAEETLIGRKRGEEEKRREQENATWDGYSSTAELTSKRAMTGISVEDQIKAIHQSQGLIEEPAALTNRIGPTTSTTQPSSFKQPPPPPPAPLSQQFDSSDTAGFDLPAAKRIKTAEECLMPEKDFLALHQAKGPVKFYVQVPVVPEKPEWNLNGQIITLVLPLTETVATIKNQLMEQLTMPPGKQKLQLDTMFIKDTNTLAFYNILPETVIQLQPKERGGRKK